MPKLETPVADAKAISQILSSKYGFKVTTLLNANRYDILSELNKMREKVTEKDNLLIYYAGHGELDKVNQRGNWLPVDAEPDSTANWIPNVSDHRHPQREQRQAYPRHLGFLLFGIADPFRPLAPPSRVERGGAARLDPIHGQPKVADRPDLRRTEAGHRHRRRTALRVRASRS